jgi:hypothetical protein
MRHLFLYEPYAACVAWHGAWVERDAIACGGLDGAFYGVYLEPESLKYQIFLL